MEGTTPIVSTGLATCEKSVNLDSLSLQPGPHNKL